MSEQADCEYICGVLIKMMYSKIGTCSIDAKWFPHSNKTDYCVQKVSCNLINIIM